MTNKERYQRTFSTLHASDNISLEVQDMKHGKKVLVIRPAVAAALCAMLVLGTGTTAYAADAGGIRTKFTAWINGESVDITIKDNTDGKVDTSYPDMNGQNINGYDGYTFSYRDENGEEIVFGGGGVSLDLDADGAVQETPLSAEEVLENFNCEVVDEEDGSIVLYYKGQKADITELYKEDAVCKVVLMDNGAPVYFDIESNGSPGGYALRRSGEPTGSADLYTAVN